MPVSTAVRRVGVVGTGAMGGGVVRALVRAGFETYARDIVARAQADAVAHGARACESAAELASRSEAIVVLVVDAPQVERVLFADDGIAQGAARGTVVCVSSTVDPAYPPSIQPRLAERGIALLDAPVSGGPAKAAAGTMTMMVSGDADALAWVRGVLERITGRLFALGERAGDASTFKIVNNLLAGAHLAVAAEAFAIARAAGIDAVALADVVNASSGASWIVADRMPRALANDLHPPRAAAKILTKDVGIAVDVATRLGIDAPIARAALAAYTDAVAAGLGDDDDAVLIRRALDALISATSDPPRDRRR